MGGLRSYPLNLIRIMPAKEANEMRARWKTRRVFF